MEWITEKFWPWFKKYWKWIVFPVGILSLVAAAIAGTRVIDTVDVDQDKLDANDDKRDEAIEEANRLRDEKLLELAEKNKERLEHISAEQEKELEDLADKPIEEVVAWFDQF